MEDGEERVVESRHDHNSVYAYETVKIKRKKVTFPCDHNSLFCQLLNKIIFLRLKVAIKILKRKMVILKMKKNLIVIFKFKSQRSFCSL